MIYTELTNKAIKYAYNAHLGQKDVNGLPYIFHPFHVAETMKDEITTCVALLHDVVEDTEIKLDDLRKDFPDEVVDEVGILTHDPKERYEDYILKVKNSKIAMAVKLADISHNSDETRFAGNPSITEERKEYWRKKYAKALEILNS